MRFKILQIMFWKIVTDNDASDVVNNHRWIIWCAHSKNMMCSLLTSCVLSLNIRIAHFEHPVCSFWTSFVLALNFFCVRFEHLVRYAPLIFDSFMSDLKAAALQKDTVIILKSAWLGKSVLVYFSGVWRFFPIKDYTLSFY